jgi:ribonuclease HI
VTGSPVIMWLPPSEGFIKLNIDGSAFGTPSCGAIGGVFRNSHAQFLGGFSQNIGHATCLEAELCAAMYAIEKLLALNWKNVWLESDSLMVVRFFSSSTHVPWKFRTRWNKCMLLDSHLNCSCSHIHREGNHAADALARNGQNLPVSFSHWWPTPSSFLSKFLNQDSNGGTFHRLLM